MHYWNQSIISITFLCLFFFTTPIFAKDDNLPPDIKKIKERGTLIVAMYHKDIKPFMFHDKQGNFIGHEVKLAKQISAALGVKVKFNRRPQTFDDIINLVAKKKADMAISLISRTMKRAQKVRFTHPYLTLRPTLLINRMTASKLQITENTPLKSLKNFTGHIGEKAGTSYVNIAKKIFPNGQITEYPEWLDTMDAVRHLLVDAALRDEIGVKNYMAAYPEQSIQLQMLTLNDPQYADQIAIALPTSSAHLQEWLNLYFQLNGVTGDADHLLDQYREYYE